MELKDLAGVSAPLTKLIEVVAEGVGSIWSTIMSRRVAEAQADRVRIEAEAQADSAVILTLGQIASERLRKDAETALVAPPPAGPAISPLNERLQSRLLFQEGKRLRNIGRITSQAVEDLGDTSTVSPEPVDPDWTSRFFANAQDVSTDEMQRLWGRVLAREVAAPGSCSLMTLDILRNLTRREAHLFESVACCVIMGKTLLRHDDSSESLWTGLGISYADMLDLDHVGLLSHADVRYTLTARKGDPVRISWSGCTVSGIAAQDRPSFPCWALTAAGRELLPLVKRSRPPREYAQLLANRFAGLESVEINWTD